MSETGAGYPSFTPREIVAELDRHIVGQNEAKRAVAIALRNRWRRLQLPAGMREDVVPKNILMIGPTGVGKTEIARRLAKLVRAPFLKVEATKFTEVGYVGRDVDQIVRDLVEVSLRLTRERLKAEVAARAETAAEDRLLEVLVGGTASDSTKATFRQKLRAGELDEKEIDVALQPGPAGGAPGTLDLQDMLRGQGGMGAFNLNDLLGQAFGGGKPKARRLKVPEALVALTSEEAEKLLDEERVRREAIQAVEQNGIVFIDEIDKVAARSEGGRGPDVSREGVQRDLLPLIEGTTVQTRYGPVATDHVLFIASGAFQVAKPSDLLPELQGRLPIRVELQALTQDDFKRILTEPEHSLLKQYTALLAVEGVTIEVRETGVDELAAIAVELNGIVENIGARRLHTVLERLLEEVSFEAPDMRGQSVVIDARLVRSRLASIARNADLSRFVL